jgi:hypothetical protein
VGAGTDGVVNCWRRIGLRNVPKTEGEYAGDAPGARASILHGVLPVTTSATPGALIVAVIASRLCRAEDRT